MALYGKQKQLKRVAIYNDFCKKTEAVLFATDIAARGLGEYSSCFFSSQEWVIVNQKAKRDYCGDLHSSVYKTTGKQHNTNNALTSKNKRDSK